MSSPEARIIILVLVFAGLVSGCQREAPPGIGAAPDTRAPDQASACSTERGEKVGVPFVRICQPMAPDAVWIAAMPHHCSPGDHGTLECPMATSLLVEPDVPLSLIPPHTALFTDATTAHRTCTMRFGGRLPTPAERRELRRTQGLFAVIATAESDGQIRIEELDEWTQSGDCGNPSKPGADCRFERSPGAGAPAIDWSALRRCQARPARPARLDPAITPGGRCPPDGPCLLRSPWFPKEDAEPLAHELACAPLDTPMEHPAPRPDIAAFRCVLPRGALTPSQ